MIDLFGMGKAPESQPPHDAAPEPAPAGGGHASHRLWALLLVFDSIFVIVFGGAVVSKVYQYWRAPAAAAAPVAPRRPAPKPPEAVKPVEPAASSTTAAAKPAPPPKPPEPEPKIARRADAPRAPKPSLVTEAPKPRAMPSLATTAAASAAPAGNSAPAASAKAQPVVFKLKASNADAVQLVGAFIVHGGRKDMTQAKDGTWSIKLYLTPGQYRYFFAVDKKKTLDPENPNSDRGASLLTVP
jgi:outer membrane biosynthesis protein TonB